MSTIDFEALLAPISDDSPSGADLSFDPLYDTIKEARRADEDYLSQGEWQTEFKVAEWAKVKELACEVLATKSKDLQVACWLTEALTNLHGFTGAHDGFVLLTRLLSDFWDSFYPSLEDDLELRVGRLGWLETNLPHSLIQLPLTGPTESSKGFGWMRWKESRDVENLARQNAEAMDEALAEGKINSELWELAVKQTPASFYETLLQETSAAQQALQALADVIQNAFGHEAPSTAQLTETLNHIVKLVAKLAADKGLGSAEPLASVSPNDTLSEDNVTPEASGRPGSNPVGPAGPPVTREEALRRLDDIARYFRQAEPYSPVTYLIEKARRWGSLRLDEWIREVVQDESTRYRLRDLLGYEEE